MRKPVKFTAPVFTQSSKTINLFRTGHQFLRNEREENTIGYNIFRQMSKRQSMKSIYGSKQNSRASHSPICLVPFQKATPVAIGVSCVQILPDEPTLVNKEQKPS